MADEVTIIVRAEDRFSSVLGNFGSIITGIESAINLAGQAFQAFTGFALEGLNAVASYERLTLALTSLNAAQLLQAGVAKDMASAMEVSSVMAEELVDWMQQLAIQSPFTLEGVAQAFRLAQAYGFSAEEAKRLTQALIDFSAGTGATEYSMQKIALALGQISTVGKLAGGDMLQLTQAGLPVAQILADAFGVTTEEIIEMRTKGLLPAQEVIEAITVWIETNFKGAAANFAISWAGIQSTFSDIRQMGMRELFTGILEAIQPLTIEISSFLQGAGMQLAAQIGDIAGAFVRNNAAIGIATDFLKIFNEYMTEGSTILSALGQAFQDIGERSDWVSSKITWLDDLGSSLLMLQFRLEQGMPFWDAFKTMLQELGESDSTLGNIADRLREFILTVEDEGLIVAFQDLFSDVWTSIDLSGGFQNLLDNLAVLMGGADWREIGDLLGTVLSLAIESAINGLDAIIYRINWAPIGEALADAFSELFAGMGDVLAGYVYWDNWQAYFSNIQTSWRQLGEDIMDGIIFGIQGNLFMLFLSLYNLGNSIITYFKSLLGISSPSTVFASIGRDIMSGLMLGLISMTSSLISTLSGIVSSILAVFAPVLNLLGIDVGTTTGTTGGRTMGGLSSDTRLGTTELPLGGSTVNNYFYGPVYFGNMSQIGYDCPSPHPLLEASGRSLLTTVNVG